MNKNYTRQRQGRDFSILNALAAAEMSIEGNYNNIDSIIGNADSRDDYDTKISFQSFLSSSTWNPCMGRAGSSQARWVLTQRYVPCEGIP